MAKRRYSHLRDIEFYLSMNSMSENCTWFCKLQPPKLSSRGGRTKDDTFCRRNNKTENTIRLGIYWRKIEKVLEALLSQHPPFHCLNLKRCAISLGVPTTKVIDKLNYSCLFPETEQTTVVNTPKIRKILVMDAHVRIYNMNNFLTISVYVEY